MDLPPQISTCTCKWTDLIIVILIRIKWGVGGGGLGVRPGLTWLGNRAMLLDYL